MSQVKYLVFEESRNILNMNKINMFKNGIDMPWTYYQADIIEHTNNSLSMEERLEAKKRFMYTSESKPGPNGEKAGEYVSEIKRWVQYGASNTYTEQIIKDPTVDDYKLWGWKLSKDPITGKEILPKYGEFTFKLGYEPSYEDIANIQVEFRFGFGLNNTCYNFSNDEVVVSIYNLSCAPKVFSSSKEHPDIKYENGNWGSDLKEEENDTIECFVQEGTPSENNKERYAYLYIAVESGEKIIVDFNDYGSGKNQIEIFNEQVNDTLDETNSRFGILSVPYRIKLEGEPNSITDNIKYDFYKIRVNAKSNYNNLKYNFEPLCLRLKIIPQAESIPLTSFQRIVTVNLNLYKDESQPYFREANEASHGFNSNAPNNFNKQINRNARLIVTAEEAINYGIRNDSGPNFLRGKTPTEALKYYKQSLLTTTEKNFDEYKKSFKSLEAREKLAHFVTTDLTNMVGNNFTNGVNQGDIKNILGNSTVQIAIDEFNGASSQELSIAEIKSDPQKASKFQDVVDLFIAEGYTVFTASLDPQVEESPFKPWTDSNIGNQRKFGGINNTTSSGGNDLLNNKTSALALLYAINNYNNNSSDELINKYINTINQDNSTDNFLVKLEKAMRNEYHGVDSISNSNSLNRPNGLYQDLFNFRRSLNPVEGKSAIIYISEIMEIIDENNKDTKHYGTNSIYTHYNMTPARITKSEADDLLYNGDFDKILQSGKLLGNDKFPIISLTNSCSTTPVFKNLGDDDTKDVMGHFYGSNDFQFSKNTLDELPNNPLKGKWVLNKSGNMENPYNKNDYFKENEDVTGIIRLPKSDEGCYFDFYVNGIEVHETMVDIETGNSDRYSDNFDPVNTYVEYNTTEELANYYLSEDIKSSRKTPIKDEIKKFNLVNAGKFQFLRFGEVVHFFANNDDYDSEENTVENFPVFKISERSDTTDECKLEINDAYIPLQDVHSELTLTINPSRGNLNEYKLGDNFNVDTDGICVSRWSNIKIPLDINGGLEKGEKFKLSIKDDFWVGKSDEKASTNEYNFNVQPQGIPPGFQQQQMFIEYKNRDEANSNWEPAKDVIFEYERHNKMNNDPALGNEFNSYGFNNNTNTIDYNKSSNIKGLPEFRLVLPPQFKLLEYYNNQISNTSIINAFGILGRQAIIELKYTKSAKLNSDGTRDLDGNNVSDEIKFLVDSDKYDPKICVSTINYNNEDKQQINSEVPIRKIGSNTSYTGYVNQTRKIVACATKLQSDEEEEVPDKTKTRSYEFNKSYLEHLDGDKKRLFEFVDLKVKENNFGTDKPIAKINISNFIKQDGSYGVSASIAPIFKYEEDEKDFEETGKYCLSDNNIPVDLTKDGKAEMPRLIPANENYSLYFTNDNTQLWLYRNKNINYEEWVGGNGGIYTYNNYYDQETGTYREIVNIQILYYNPQTEDNTPRKASIICFVEPKDVKEIHYLTNFHFTVNEGTESVDITPILSATLEGKTSNKIEYYIRGIVDEAGVSHFFDSTKNNAVNDLTSKLYTSQVNFTNEDIKSGLTTESNKNVQYTDAVGIGGQAMKNKNLLNEVVNGKLMLYHENFGVAPLPNLNNKFDTYYQKYFKFYVEAIYNVQNQGTIENSLTLVTIEVENEGTNFYLKNNKWYHDVVETMGTIAEGKGELGNNPEIPMSTFLDNLRHEDLGDIKLYNQENITFQVVEIDPALEIKENYEQTDFSNQIIRLKDIDSNKTTETETETSSKLAPFAHYNYERQENYQITLEVCLTNNYEINVEKLPSNYVFGIGQVDSKEYLNNRTSSEVNKTATYIVRAINNNMFLNSDPVDHQHNGKLYYFKDSTTGLYHGPLSVIPKDMEDLHNIVKIHGVNVYHAYARFEGEENCYTALYKANGFRDDLTKPPKPQDICLQPFSINVLNSYDKPKVNPQPYKLLANNKHCYRKSDPYSGEKLEFDNIEAFECKSHVAYVFSDHEDLDRNLGKDIPDEFNIPYWHPDYKNPSDSDYVEGDNKAEQYDREIHENASMCNFNAGYNNGLYNGVFDKNVQGSWEFGKFAQEGADDAVILDFFIEYHERINPSGTNSIFTGKTPFGTPIDYTGTLKYNDGVNGPVFDSDKRMYRLSNINRSKKHTENHSLNSYYATAELEMNSQAKAGEVYCFTVVAVSNVLATSNDIKYNKNMVDWNETYYPKIYKDGKEYPQPFQKYAYDASANKIVTHAYANSLNILGGLNHNNVDEADKGTLLCLRTHFTVKVKSETDYLETTITSKTADDNEISHVVSGNGNLQVDSVIKGMINNDNNILPLESIPTPNEDDLRLFNIGNNKIIMGLFKDNKWVPLE